MADLPLPCLCLVTDRRRFGARPLEEIVALAVDGGANMVQLREKDLPASALLDLALKIRSITHGRASFFVNDRVDVALASGADGVQLGEEALPVFAVRHIAGSRLLIGRSVHSVEGAIEAERQGADLLIVGTIFPSESHPGAAGVGVELLSQVQKMVAIPFLAIGGVTAANIGSAIQAGASGAAVAGAIGSSVNVKKAARDTWEAMASAWSARAGRV